MEDSKEKMLVPEVKLINLKKNFLVADLGLVLKKESLLLKTNSEQNFRISCSGAPCFLLASHLSIPTGGRCVGEGLEVDMVPRQVKPAATIMRRRRNPFQV